MIITSEKKKKNGHPLSWKKRKMLDELYRKGKASMQLSLKHIHIFPHIFPELSGRP